MTEEVGTGCHLADLSVADWWRCLAIAAYREEHPAVIGQMQVLCFDRTVDPLADAGPGTVRPFTTVGPVVATFARGSVG